VAAKTLNFQNELWRWIVATPPLLAGGLLAFEARRRWAAYEEAMRTQRPLPGRTGLTIVGVGWVFMRS